MVYHDLLIMLLDSACNACRVQFYAMIMISVSRLIHGMAFISYDSVEKLATKLF